MNRLTQFFVAISVLFLFGLTVWVGFRVYGLVRPYQAPREVSDGAIPTVGNPATGNVSVQPLTAKLSQSGVVQAGDGSLLKQYGRLSIAVDWQRGATPVSFSETGAMLRLIDPSIEQNRIDLFVPDRTLPGTLECGRGTTSALCQVYLFVVGKITAPNPLAGQTLYLIAIPNVTTPGYAFANVLAVFDRAGKRFIAIGEEPPIVGSLFSGMIESPILEDITAPTALRHPTTRDEYIFVGAQSEDVDELIDIESAQDNRGGVIDIPGRRTVDYAPYTSSSIAFVHPEYGPVYFVDNTFALIADDGSVARYELKPYFLQDTRIEDEWKARLLGGFTPLIRWTDGRVAKEDRYVLGGIIGSTTCESGVVPGTNIIDREPWFDSSRVVPVGQTYSGDIIYSLGDKATNPYYRTIYQYGYATAALYGQADTITVNARIAFDRMTEAERFADFLADEPLFFWRDPSGHWRVYMKATYRTISTCNR